MSPLRIPTPTLGRPKHPPFPSLPSLPPNFGFATTPVFRHTYN
jgi:hypothetical protein